MSRWALSETEIDLLASMIVRVITTTGDTDNLGRGLPPLLILPDIGPPSGNAHKHIRGLLRSTAYGPYSGPQHPLLIILHNAHQIAVDAAMWTCADDLSRWYRIVSEGLGLKVGMTGLALAIDSPTDVLRQARVAAAGLCIICHHKRGLFCGPSCAYNRHCSHENADSYYCSLTCANAGR